MKLGHRILRISKDEIFRIGMNDIEPKMAYSSMAWASLKLQNLRFDSVRLYLINKKI